VPARELEISRQLLNIGRPVGKPDGRSVAEAAQKRFHDCLLLAKSREVRAVKYCGQHSFQPESGQGVSGERSSLCLRVAVLPDFVTHTEG
jgi:hypothetical protein